MLLGIALLASVAAWSLAQSLIPTSDQPSALDIFLVPISLALWLQFALLVGSLVALAVATVQYGLAIARRRVLHHGAIGASYFAISVIALMLAGVCSRPTDPIGSQGLLLLLVPRLNNPRWTATAVGTVIVGLVCIWPFRAYQNPSRVD